MAAPPVGRVRVPDQHGVQGAAGRLLASAGVLEGLQGVQDHVGGVLGHVLPLQLAQLMKGRVHGFLNVLVIISRGWGGFKKE